MRKSSIAWLIISVLIIFGARAWSHYDDTWLFIQITLKSSVAGVAQIYYDLGQGLSEDNSVRSDVSNNVGFNEYRFPIPNKKIYGLRFDPLMSEGHVEIRQIRIVDRFGNVFKDFDITQLRPVHQINSFIVHSQQVSLDMSAEADDPQIEISVPEPLLFKRFHKIFFIRQLQDFLAVALAVILLTLWATWEDRKQVKRWIFRGVIAAGLMMVVFFFLQTCLDILRKSILPSTGGDTEVFLYMAAQRWTSPDFYHGLRPWTVPLFYSLVDGARNNRNLILLQTTVSYASWIFLAFNASRLIKDDALKAVAFIAIACIPLNLFIQYWNVVILSESLSFSFLAIFLGTFFWYFRTGSKVSVLALTVVALLFSFTRDTDAYRVLFMSIPVLVIVTRHFPGRSRGTLRHAVLCVSFLMIFITSDLSSSNTHYSGLDIPNTNDRWYFPMLDNMGSRILQNEEMLRYFADHGLPVTPALREMAGKYASTGDWQWYKDPSLQTQREWLYLHGRATYLKYLLTHPSHTLQSAYSYRSKMLFIDDATNAWYHEMAKPINLRILSPLFLNDVRDYWVFLVLFPATLILICLVCVRRGRRDFGERGIDHIILISYIILITIPHAVLVFHGDLMDLIRHQYTNIIQLNIGIVLFYLLAVDWWLSVIRLFMKKGPFCTTQSL